MKKRLFAIFMVICMITSIVPVSAFAAECEHHLSHTAECGYKEAVAGVDCTHECGEDCSTEAGCIHGDNHDESCGYVAAVEGADCTFVCDQCGADPADENSEADDLNAPTAEDCTCTSLCPETLPEDMALTCSWCLADHTQCACEPTPSVPVADEGDGKDTSIAGEGAEYDADGKIIAGSVQEELSAYAAEVADPTVWDGSSVSTAWTGSGTAEDPYMINSAAELAGLAQSVNGGNEYSGMYFRLGADINLDNKSWTPIGTQNNCFYGIFDGDNHTIRNLYFNNANSWYVGLFGYTKGGAVKNFTLTNANVTGQGGVGAVAGSPYTSAYSNILVNGHIEINGMAYVGGAMGYMAYNNLTNVDVAGDASSYVYANSKGSRAYVGGLIGFMGEGNITVRDCDVAIKVTGTTCNVGGLMGILQYNNTLINCTYTGTVTLEAPDTDSNPETNCADEFGALVGTINNDTNTKTQMLNCTFTGTAMKDAADVTSTIPASGDLYNNSAGTNSLYVAEATVNNVATVDTNAAASVAGTYYLNVDDAITAAVDSKETVTVWNDVTLTPEQIESIQQNNIKVDPNGNKVTDANGGTVELPTSGVAEVNGTSYATLEEAIEVATADQTVTLLADVTIAPIIISKKMTLDLNGHTIKGSKVQYMFLVNGGNLTVTDNSEGALGKIVHEGGHSSTSMALWVYNGTLTLKAGAIENESDNAIYAVATTTTKSNVNIQGGTVSGKIGIFATTGTTVDMTTGSVTGTEVGIKLNKLATANISGGEVSGYTENYKPDTACDGVTVLAESVLNVSGNAVIKGLNSAIGGNGSAGNGETTITIKDNAVVSSGAGATAIFHPQAGTLNVSGGTIAGGTGIYMKSGDLTVTGGIIKGTGEAVDYKYEGSGCTATGDAVVIDNCGYPGGEPSANITGGTFESANNKQIGAYFHATETNNVTGVAEVNSTNTSLSIPEGYKWDENGKLVEDKKVYVAEVSGQKYEDLQAAIDAAEAGQTVKLLSDVTLADNTAIKIVGKDLTLDLNGKTLSGKNNKTGMTLTTTVPAGILHIADSTVILADSSSEKTGSIVNNNSASSSASTICVFSTTSAKLTINDGIAVTYSASSGTPIYAKGANTEVEINDITITSGSTAFRTNSSAKYVIHGGTFDAATTIGGASSSASSLITVNSATFITGALQPSYFTIGTDYVTYKALDDGRYEMVFTNTQPTDYTAKIHTSNEAYNKAYLIAGNLTLFKNWIKDNTDAIEKIEIRKDTAIVGVTLGETGTAPTKVATLKLEIAEGATFTGTNFKLGNADVVITGAGSVATDSFIAANTNYVLSYDTETKTYSSRIPDEKKVVLVSFADGTTEKFVTTQAAFNAVNAFAKENPDAGASTITLTQNMTESVFCTVNAGTEVILDLGDFTWSNDKYMTNMSPLNNKGTLTIQNGAFTAPMNVANNAAITNEGILTIADNATVSRTYKTQNINVSTIINKGTVTNNGQIVADYGNGIYSNGSNAVIDGTGTIKSNFYGVYVKGGTATIKNADIVANTHAVFVDTGTAKIEGGKYDVLQEDKSLLINCLDANYDAGKANVIITGGTYAGWNPSGNASEGAGTVFTADGYVGVYDAATESFTAVKELNVNVLDADGRVVGTYTTLQEAVNAFKEGHTIKLLADIENMNRIVLNGKSAKIDLNGHSISSASGTQCFGVINGATLELTGTGTVKESNPYYAPILFQCGTSENVTTVTIGENVTLEGWTGIMIDQGGNGANTTARLTVNMNGTINSKKDTSGNDGSGIYINGNIGNNEVYPTINVGTTARIDGGEGVGIHAAGYAVWNVEGSVTGSTGIYAKSGVVNVKDGATVNGNGEQKDYVYAPSGLTSTGDAIVSDNCGYPGGAPVINITGGTISSTNGNQVAAYFGNTADTIGQVTSTNTALTVPEAYEWNENGKLVAKAFTITYELDGGSVATENPTSYTIEDEAITLNNPEKPGYTFAGWMGTDLDEASTSVTIAKGSSGNRTYTATWNVKTYTVTFVANGGEGTMAELTHEGTFTLPECTFVAPDGKQFKGWASSAEGDVYTETELTIDKNIILYAIWENTDHVHGNGVLTEAVDPDCGTGTNGSKAYYTCSCGQKYYDAACTKPVLDAAELVVQWSHTGGTATCTSAAKCSECGQEYGELGSHGETEIRDAKAATCAAEGYTGDTYCKDCGVKLESGKAIAKTAHTYKNGKCTVCKTADPNYNSDVPATGDNELPVLWFSLFVVSALGAIAALIPKRKKGKYQR